MWVSVLCGGDKTVSRTGCTSDTVTDGVGETGVAGIGETLANPHHPPWLYNDETCSLHASHLGKNVWENHVLEIGEEGEKTHGETGDIFGHDERERVSRNRNCVCVSCYSETRVCLFQEQTQYPQVQ